ncbi:MAG: ankyrin repeat domain-containing protein, partial [Gammaproteobacteria bacterium]
VWSMYKLGRMFLKGTLEKIDLERAEQFFIQAAENGDEDDINYLGTLYLNKVLNYDQNVVNKTIWFKRAIELWKKQALLGNTRDLVNLIQVYLDQELGFKDPEKANSWLSISIQHDDEEKSETALYVAFSEGYTETVSALLEVGADVNRVIQRRNTIFSTIADDDFNILTLVVNKKLITMANKIFTTSIDLQKQFVNIVNLATSIEQIVDFIIQNKGDLNATEKDQITLLIMACAMNNYNSVEKLVIAGADKNAKDVHATALHYAFVCKDVNILKFLLKQDCDLNILDSE